MDEGIDAMMYDHKLIMSNCSQLLLSKQCAAQGSGDDLNNWVPNHGLFGRIRIVSSAAIKS